jgi:hypothetical protein
MTGLALAPFMHTWRAARMAFQPRRGGLGACDGGAYVIFGPSPAGRDGELDEEVVSGDDLVVLGHGGQRLPKVTGGPNFRRGRSSIRINAADLHVSCASCR